MGADSLSGVLFKYGPKPIQVAFKTGDYRQQVIFIGGLSDGFLATEYLEPLAIALDKEKWSLVQPLLSSSYSGYGTSSLKQDIVHYMRTNAACSRAVRAAILQVIDVLLRSWIRSLVVVMASLFGEARVCETGASSSRPTIGQVIALETLKDKIATQEAARDAREAQIATQFSAQDEKMSVILRALQMSGLQIPMLAPDLAPPSTSQPLRPTDTQ